MLPFGRTIGSNGSIGSSSQLCEFRVFDVSPAARPARSGKKAYHRLKPRYHNDVNDWDFGKLSALREIELAFQNGRKFYYMGNIRY